MVFDTSNKTLRDLYNRDKKYEQVLSRLKIKEMTIPQNRKVILDFLQACEEGTTLKRRNAQIRKLRLIKYVAWLPKISEWYGKPFSKIDEEAYQNFMRNLDNDKIVQRNGKPYSHNTKLDIKKMNLKFWKWLSDYYDKPDYFFMADRFTKYDKPELDPDAYHYTQVWNFAQNLPLQYEFIIKVCFDGGFRPTELFNLRKKDFYKVEEGGDYYYKVSVKSDTSKTIGRTISLRLSSDAIDRYLKSLVNLKPDDFVISKSDASVRKQFGRIAKANELNYGLTFTILRHSSMTHYAPLIKNQTRLEYRYGEATNSSAIKHYIRRSGLLDKETADEIKVDMLSKINAERVKEKQRTQQMEEELNDMKEKLNELLSNKEVRELIISSTEKI